MAFDQDTTLEFKQLYYRLLANHSKLLGDPNSSRNPGFKNCSCNWCGVM